MKIAIIGAGISGCTAYLQLKKHLPGSHTITIYESHDTSKDRKFDASKGSQEEDATHSSTLIVGGGLGIGPNGLHVLKRLDEDLLRDIVRGGYVAPHGNLKSKHGRLLIRMDNSAPGAGDEPPVHMVGCSREWLWRCLRERIPDGDIVTKRVERVVASPDDRNTIYFKDGSPAVEADLVIGADGIKSVAKRALFPEAEEDPFPPHYEGVCGIGGFLPSSEVKDLVEKGSMNFIFGGNGFFGYFFSTSSSTAPHRDSPHHVSEPGDLLAWWSTYSVDECPDTKTLDMDDVLQQLHKRHEHWGDPVVRKVLKSARVKSMYPTWTSPQLPTWERDGVVLVGDAAHALPSTSGQGSSQALEDVESFAKFLSYFLGKVDGNGVNECKEAVKLAAKQYMDLRRPRIQAILADARKKQNKKRDMGVIEEYLMYSIMWIMGMYAIGFGDLANIESKASFRV
ncbi:FAD-dependent oxidoreductase [Aspergillus fischeri NRRL 181]|uniref:FAD binding domain protein n=1 Tax=Neosartorya fischeri (strain ATCC 1020 / DSM 3700 / CBS 544.65 / FGSC A1164 / JCM 1740 / NRRL 181 / WB 181) TaxID=331117 RepID=A1CVW4_NEOFI|nr:FAD binding domain protein [Aspergillus fischeri NRRL 181]EAW24766.1 FAD binding domain protein [Aspergillus fischeri NRRL 181]